MENHSLYIPYIDTKGKQFTNYAQVLEQSAAKQMEAVMKVPWVIKGALMADAHHGYTLPIGGVVACKDVISPAFVGKDIGCGVLAQKVSMNPDVLIENCHAIRNAIATNIPTGFKHQHTNKRWDIYKELPKSEWFNWMFHAKHGYKQLGTLGGGNHFIEVGLDEQQAVWFIIHSGSRNVGSTTADHYIAKAHPEGKVKDGVYGFGVDTQDGKDYLDDMNVCLKFALANRQFMASKILNILQSYDSNATAESWFINRTHNHAEYNKELGLWIHRKGATHAEDNMLGVIPGNMRDGSFIVSGKGNPDSLFSSSHGAGRVLSRKKAKAQLNVEEVKKELADIGIAVNVTASNIDEAPAAYKSIFDVIKLQQDLVNVMAHVKPKVIVKG